MRNTKVLLAFGALVLLNLAFGAWVLLRGHHEAPDPRLTHEALALPRLADAHSVFFTPASHADVAAARPDLVAHADEHAYAQGAQMPEVFRRLDHEKQFDAVLLAGDPTTYKPLLTHLGETKDFTLAWLDDEALVFRRHGTQAWREADLDATAAQFQGENKARFLAGAATRLIAIGQLAMAKRALDVAEPLGQGVPEMWTALALFQGEIAHWPDALDSLNKALKLDPDFTPALTTKAQILYGARRYDEALQIMDKVVDAHPDDPSMLFLQATISHQAHSYDREITVLNHLIELAEAQKQSSTGYRIYLGQAYAETGEAIKSLTQFELALESPDISEAQRKFATDCVEKIGTKMEEAQKQ